MDLFETILLNVIFIIFPLTFCLLYQTYNQTLNKEKGNLILDFALFSSFYLILRFSLKLSMQLPILFFNIPLIIAYVKRRKIDIIFLSFMIVLYYYTYLNIPILFLILEYSLYYGIYQICSKKENNSFVTSALILKCFSIGFEVLYITKSIKLIDIIIIEFFFFIVTKFTIYLFERVEEVLALHLKFKDFEKEKKIRESLFKITHEIKNPIAVCKGYLDMFDIHNVEHSRKYIPIIKEEIARILVLLQDFLSIHKIKIEKEIMDVNLLIENIYRNFEPILEDKEIEADFQVTEDELYINGDYNRLSQVLINIIKNSIESIPEDQKGKISISLEEDKSSLKIIVSDNGKGMNQEELSKIKEPFFTTKKKGTGLGIYLSDEIMKGHNGFIHYSSKEGIGTTVTLTFNRDLEGYDM